MITISSFHCKKNCVLQKKYFDTKDICCTVSLKFEKHWSKAKQMRGILKINEQQKIHQAFYFDANNCQKI